MKEENWYKEETKTDKEEEKKWKAKAEVMAKERSRNMRIITQSRNFLRLPIHPSIHSRRLLVFQSPGFVSAFRDLDLPISEMRDMGSER
jgi:hypothetical protein